MSGSTIGAVRVVGELDASALEVGEAVIDVAAVEIGPAGHRAGLEAPVAGGRREVEDFLPGGDDPAAEQVGKQLGQPRPEREDEPVGVDRARRLSE